MRERILTGVLFGIVSLFLILFNDTTRLLYIYIAAGLSVLEYLKMQIPNKPFKTIAGLLIYLTPLVLLHFVETDLKLITIITTVVMFAYLFSLRLEAVSRLHTKIWPLFIFISFGLSVALFGEIVKISEVNFLLFVTLFIWIADSAAYFVGRVVGKRKFAPKVSPKKTWEGFIGAGMIVAIASYIISSLWFKEYNYQLILLLALAVWLFGALGDLAQSHIKRSYGIKDSGNLLPGHGGFYDRFDGFIYCLPFASLIILFIINS